MRIDRATLFGVSLPLKVPFVTSFGPIDARHSLLVKVESEGLCGWGEAPLLPIPVYNSEFLQAGKALLAEHILPRLAGAELAGPWQAAGLYSEMKGNNQAKAGLETALWDLFARREGKPLCRYLGARRNAAEVGISLGVKDDKRLLDEIAAALADGYKRIKVKIAPGRDVAVVRSIRSCYPQVPLMVDANSAYTLKDVETFKALDEYGLMMIEQPLAYDDLVDHAELQRQIATPVCLDESIVSAEHARKGIELGSCRIINLKPGRVGGLGESLEVLAVCQAHGVGVWIGGQLESGIGKTMLVHLAMHEAVTLPGDLAPPRSYLREDLTVAAAPAGGMISVGPGPGLGIEIEQATLEKYLTDKLVIKT